MEEIIKEKKAELKEELGSLDGWCHYCSLKLAEELNSRGKSPVIVWGALNEKASDIEELEKNVGDTHFWVSIKGTNKCLDLYSNTSDRGKSICKNSPPRTYYEYARIEYKTWMDEENFISYSDFQELEKKGTVIEKR